MPNFASGPGGINLEDGFLRETDIIDRYVGNQLWLWGDNTIGQLGDGTTADRSSPIQTISGGTNWKKISTLNYSNDTCGVIKSDGSLWVWGENNIGQLGIGNITHRSSPVQTLSSGTNWKELSINSVAAAIKTDGTLWMWGENTFGQLGTGNITHRSSPVQTIAGGTNWKFVSTGRYYTAAIKTDGTLWSWGRNFPGGLGDGTNTNRSSPVQTVAGGNNWKQLSVSSRHTGAIKTDGTLWLWGEGNEGGLGDGTITDRSSPIQTISGGNNWKQVSTGTDCTGAIKTDGTLWMWGSNSSGKLGDNTVISKSSPIQTISGGTNWKFISTGYLHSAGIKTDGTLWLWGNNSQGEIADGTRSDRASPVQTIAGGTNWKSVKVMDSSTIAITFAES